MIRFEGVQRVFPGVTALAGLDLEIEDGELIALLGPSGCGKTTTLNLIAGFINPGGGTISLGNRLVADAARGIAVSPDKRDLGMVFQSYALWPHMSVRKNLSFGLEARGYDRIEIGKRIDHALEGTHHQRRELVVALLRTCGTPEVVDRQRVIARRHEPLGQIDVEAVQATHIGQDDHRRPADGVWALRQGGDECRPVLALQ